MDKLIYLIVILFLMMSVNSLAQSESEIDSLQTKAEEKFNEGDEKESLDLYLEILKRDSTHYDALWNASLINSRLGYQLGDDKEKKQLEYYNEALDLADKAIEHHGDKGHSYYVKAVALGRWGELQDTETRIKTSHKIKENVEKAADMIPNYAPVWHLYGVFHSDVANISGAEKFAANLISKGVPDASNKKAEEYIKKAIEMMPESILFRLDLAKHYLKVDDEERAKKVLEEITGMDVTLPNEGQLKEEAAKILEDL
ncbi:tetratricopeptide repeat protein [Rhodohalobacter sp.]|uniref:tetratricopeptide repeat protein n=1 Tax=Rhodohalobacter sp. TaxID=1974210 RepID=UPI002ACE1681|nr:tetratricopeptide repeat protein [Rhodohalobacter sp.]MDZ7754959.1 tetratricopeptide repeat protein [Rhodohalobacter sp.]